MSESSPPSIPIELYPFILRYLYPEELVPCLRVSRAFYHTAALLLYRKVSINLYTRASPICTKRRPVSTPSGFMKAYERILNRVKGIDEWAEMKLDREERKKEEARDKEEREMRRRGVKIISPSKSNKIFSSWFSKLSKQPIMIYHTPLLHPFDLITHLVLHDHNYTQCQQLDSLIMPNLQILQFIPILPNDNIDWYHCHHWDTHDTCLPDSECSCPLISHLRPRKLIYGDKESGACRPSLGFWPEIPIWLEEMVLYACHVDGLGIGPELSGRWAKSDMKQDHHLKRLTIVLQPERGMGVGEIGEDGVFRHIFTGGEMEQWYSGELWDRLALAIEEKPEILEIVGLELIDMGWGRGRPVYLDRDKMREELIKALGKRGWGYDMAEEMVQKVRFTAKAEYRDEGGSRYG